MVKQLSLQFGDIAKSITKDKNENKVNIKTRKEISVYVIEDIVTQRKYVGISNDPLSRIANHYSGKGSRALFNDYQLRPSDFKDSILGSFSDPNFSKNNTQSLAYHVEALMIAFYNSINEGYNTKFYINVDFEEESFWLNILPSNFQKFYINSNKIQLNKNIENYLPTKYDLRLNILSSTRYDVKVKNLYRKKLQEMIDKRIPIYLYAKDLCNINRSQLHRFMKGMNSAHANDRLAELIFKIEDYLDIEHRFDLQKELIEYIKKEAES